MCISTVKFFRGEYKDKKIINFKKFGQNAKVENFALNLEITNLYITAKGLAIE